MAPAYNPAEVIDKSFLVSIPNQQRQNQQGFHRKFLDKSLYLTCPFGYSLLDRCIENKGAWLREGEFTQVGWDKLKHASSSESVFVARVLESLQDGKQLKLEDEETIKYRRMRNAKLIIEPDKAFHSKTASEVRSDTSIGNELKEAVPQTNSVATKLGTFGQQSLRFELADPPERIK